MKSTIAVITILVSVAACASPELTSEPTAEPTAEPTQNADYQITPFAAPYPGATGDPRDTVSVATDSNGSILVLRRSDPPVLIYNRAGELQDSWGTGLFVDTHNIDVDPEGYVWIGDRNGQMVYKMTMDGTKVMSIGTHGVAGDNSSEYAFNRASDVFVTPTGDIFVADGYENNRIVHYSGDGQFINIIGGSPGTGPGQFEEIHGVQMDSQGRLVVLDRHTEDPRIQVWDPDGTFIEEWSGLGLTYGSGFIVDEDDTFWVGDTNGHQLLIVKDGQILQRIDGLEAESHQMTRDTETGDIYLADTGAPGGMIWKVTKQ